MIARGADASRIAVCPTNIDAQRWQAAPELRASVRATLGVADDEPLILFAGRLVPQKRPRLAVQVLHRLSQSGVHFRAVFAGAGEDSLWLRWFVRWNGLHERVQLLGGVPRERVRELLAASDVLLLPSDYEGVAIILYEALAMGVVPVASDVGGQRELMTPDCGVLVPRDTGEHDEIAGYAAALTRLLNDRELRERMGQAARQRVLDHFSEERMLDRMQTLLDQASDLASRAPRATVSPGVGLATAALAIEHHLMEIRLRALLPVRLLLALRRSSLWRLRRHVSGVGHLVEQTDRRMYALRRMVMKQVRRWRRWPFA
jgi:glycosyltransferase involved in cell wall biosynthesis